MCFVAQAPTNDIDSNDEAMLGDTGEHKSEKTEYNDDDGDHVYPKPPDSNLYPNINYVLKSAAEALNLNIDEKTSHLVFLDSLL